MNFDRPSSALSTWGISSLIGAGLGAVATLGFGGVFRFGIVLNVILCAVGAAITRWSGRELMRGDAERTAFARADAVWSAAGAALVLLLGAFGGFAD